MKQVQSHITKRIYMGILNELSKKVNYSLFDYVYERSYDVVYRKIHDQVITQVNSQIRLNGDIYEWSE